MADSEHRTRTFTEEIELAGTQLIERIKELVAEGNVRTIRLKTASGNEPFLELPMTGGVVGGGVLLLAAPWLAAIGALAAVVAKVKVEVVREVEVDEAKDEGPGSQSAA